jgi:hypothetical protein
VFLSSFTLHTVSTGELPQIFYDCSKQLIGKDVGKRQVKEIILEIFMLQSIQVYFMFTVHKIYNYFVQQVVLLLRFTNPTSSALRPSSQVYCIICKLLKIIKHKMELIRYVEHLEIIVNNYHNLEFKGSNF